MLVGMQVAILRSDFVVVHREKEIPMRLRWILQLVVLTGLTALPVAGLKAGENEKKEAPRQDAL